MSVTRIVVPCYNEVVRLDRQRFVRFADQHAPVRFLFVNDGSSDDTPSLLEDLCRTRPHRMDVLHLPANQGKAEAVRQGMLHAMETGATAAGYWDADLSTPLDAIPEYMKVLRSRSEVSIVLGTRLPLLGRRVQRHWFRRRVGRLFAWCASRIIGIPIYDTQCGAKLFRVSDTTHALFVQPFVSRWIFDVELLVRWRSACQAAGDSARRGLYELPLEEWHEVKGSKLKSNDFIRAVGELWTIWRRQNRWKVPTTSSLPTPTIRRAA